MQTDNRSWPRSLLIEDSIKLVLMKQQRELLAIGECGNRETFGDPSWWRSSSRGEPESRGSEQKIKNWEMGEIEKYNENMEVF